MGSRAGKIGWVFVSSLVLAECASAPVTPPPPVLTLAPSASRLVFFRPSAFISSGRVPIIAINGHDSCLLTNGSGFVTDVAPGVVNITAGTPGFNGRLFGTAKFSLTATAGQTYYVEFKPNDGAVFAPSLLVELASGDQTGAFDISMGDSFELGKIVPAGCKS